MKLKIETFSIFTIFLKCPAKVSCSSIIKDNELGYLSKNDRYYNPSGKTSHKEKHTEKYQRFGEILNDVREKYQSTYYRTIEHKFNKE